MILIAIAIAVVIAAPLGGYLGLQMGGLQNTPTGIRNVHRGKLARNIGALAGFFLGLITNACLVDGPGAIALVTAAVSAFLGAAGALYLCGVWFKKYKWDGPR